MSAVQSGKFSFVLLAAIALASSVLPNAGYAYTADEQQACQGDAFRLCGPEIPDVDRVVTACMVKKRSQLSPPCQVFFRWSAAQDHDQGRKRKVAQIEEAGKTRRGLISAVLCEVRGIFLVME